MVLVIAGKNDIAVDVLEYAIKHIGDIDIYVVLNSNDKMRNVFQKSLGFYASLWNIPIIELEDVYSIENVVFLSLEFDKIIKPKLFKSNKLFNIHFSLLPSYKGMYTSAIPILRKEMHTGVTLHKIDHGIDTGDIIYQEMIPISDSETARSLYLKYIDKGTILVKKYLKKLIDEKFSSVKQKSENSSYFSKDFIDYNNLVVDYKDTAQGIVNQLRAYSFREYQLPSFKGNSILSWEILDNRSQKKSGTIINETSYSVILSTIDYDIRLIFDFYPILWEAAKTNNLKAFKKLFSLPLNVDLEEKNPNGWTALMIASYSGSFDVVRFLIEQNADVNAKNINGTTVLMYAKSGYLINKERKIFDFLMRNGALTSPKDIYNRTIFDWIKLECPELSKTNNND